jgi:hypothetical protein
MLVLFHFRRKRLLAHDDRGYHASFLLATPRLRSSELISVSLADSPGKLLER